MFKYCGQDCYLYNKAIYRATEIEKTAYPVFPIANDNIKVTKDFFNSARMLERPYLSHKWEIRGAYGGSCWEGDIDEDGNEIEGGSGLRSLSN